MSDVTSTASTYSEDAPARTSPLTWKRASVLLAFAIVVAWYFWGGSASNTSSQRSSLAGNVPETPGALNIDGALDSSATSDETHRKLFVGTWETDRNGRRELTVNEDGTAVMDVTINNTLARMLMGERIVLDLDWKIENGVLTMITTGGKPANKVSLMMSMYGKERDQKIIVLDETTLHHPDDEPDGKDHIWKRIAE